LPNEANRSASPEDGAPIARLVGERAVGLTQAHWLWSIGRTLLTIFLGASAFMIGAITSVGIGFLPLIDTAHLLILLAFYASFISLIIQFVVLMGRTLATQTTLMDATPGLWLRERSWGEMRNYIRRRKNNPARARGLRVATTILTALFAIVVATYFVTINWTKFAPLPLLPNAPILLVFCAVILILLLTTFLPRWSKRVVGPLRVFSLSLVAVFGLLTLVQAGRVWVAYLEREGPRLVFKYVDSSVARRGTVVMPAINGLLVFYEGELGARYVPWASIDELTPTEQ
jgi:hypothetical protein